MKVTIDYTATGPQHIGFEYSEYEDTLLMAKIIDRVTKKDGLPDYTYVGTYEMAVEYKDTVIKSLTFEGNTDFLQRIIHLTIGNHWHMLKEECLRDRAQEAKPRIEFAE